MPEFRLYPRDDSPDLWMSFQHNGRRVRCSTGCTDPKLAEAAAWDIFRTATDPAYAASKKTLKDALDLLLRDREERVAAKKGSAETLSFYTKKAGHLLRVLEHEGDPEKPRTPFFLTALDGGVVDDYISVRRQEGAKDATIYKELVCWRAAMKLAKRRRWWALEIAEVFPVAFSPQYKPRERFLNR